MNRQFLSTIVLAVSLVFVFSLVSADTLFVKSYRAKVLDAPQSGKTIQLLARGTKVEEIQRAKNWIEINFNLGKGWVHQLSLSKISPPKRVSLLANRIDISSKARKRASSYTSTASARGLVDKRRMRLADRKAPDFTTLIQIEQRTINPEEAVAYLYANE